MYHYLVVYLSSNPFAVHHTGYRTQTAFNSDLILELEQELGKGCVILNIIKLEE